MTSKLPKSDRSAVSKAVAVGTIAVVIVLVGVMLTVSPPSGASQTAKPVEKTFSLTQQEWGFNQTKGGPSITVTRGEKVILQVKNLGQFPHDIAVVDDAENILWNTKSKEQQQPGNNARVEFTAREAGTYRLICTIPGHSQLGMEAKLIVQPS